MKGQILIAMEHSGTIRDEFLKAGFDAWSCDLLPCESDITGRHYQCDIRELLKRDPVWLVMIAHPDCTYLTCSAEWAYGDGPYHQKVKPETLVGAARRAAREEGLKMVQYLMDQDQIEHIAVENPRGVISTRIRPADQYIQPFDYGDDASKITGLWLKNLPCLVPTTRFAGRIVEWPKGSGKMVERWSNQTDSGQNRLPPGKDRWKHRSKFYPGWAKAMVQQWGPLLLNFNN